jgi:RNA polymerase-interacting CarD/CdnL/TRCF family regulator
MKMTDIKFSKGDWVVHAQHGIGQVEDLSIKKLADHNVVCLEVKTKALTYFLPINDVSAHHIRHISTPRHIKEALEIIASTPDPISTDYRIRNKHINDEIAKGSLASRASLIRDLNGRSVIRSNEVNENSALNRLKLQLVDEMMLVFDIDRPDAQKKLDRALQKSGNSHSD